MALLLGATGRAAAHKPSDAQLRLTVDTTAQHVTGRLDIAIRDLDAALVIDDGDGTVTWGELVHAEPRIAAYVTDRIALAGCHLTLGSPALVDLSDGAYWSVPIVAPCDADAADALTLTYRLLFDIDAQHRGLVHVGDVTHVVRDPAPVRLNAAGSPTLTFVREGIWHIWIGLDHILFLVCLLLPAVWPRRGAQLSFRGVAMEVFEIVTAFTLAHSITLVISAVGLVTLPSRFVETAIALSVVAAAVNNLVRLVDARWAVAFVLGLLHGFGFSSVLVDLGLPSRELVGALLGFNLGVEVGQAAIVIVVLPLLYVIRRTLAYRVLLFGGSAAAALLASYWTYARLG